MIDGRLSVAVGGQSLAQMFRMYGRRAFAARLRALAPAAPPARLWGLAKGGTVAASSNVSPLRRDQSARYWWDMAADAPSPLIAALFEKAGRLAEQPCECLVWDLGQFEADALKGKHGRDPAAARADYAYAMRATLAAVRGRLSPADPEALPILLVPHAPHPAEARGGGLGVQRVRAVQYELVAAIPNCHDAGIVRGMEMNDNLHPTRRGIELYAENVAETFARVILPRALAPAAAPLSPAACAA